jgi:hypothetical protein
VQLRRGGGSIPDGGWNAGYLSGHGYSYVRKMQQASDLFSVNAMSEKCYKLLTTVPVDFQRKFHQ